MNIQIINSIIYTDKSVMSYNESFTSWNINWLSPDNILKHEVTRTINNSVMENQLYILWTVFSENTIWGSRLSPPVCPYYTSFDSSFVCSSLVAQKYDLNYLRSDYKNQVNPLNYPIVIKYNSAVQSTPPPLFNN